MDRARRDACDKAGAIIIVGCPFHFRMGYGKRLRADARAVQGAGSGAGSGLETKPYQWKIALGCTV